MKYSIRQFQQDFPNEDVCLDYIFRKRYPEAQQYYRVKGRKCYADTQGKQIHPLKGTIFEKSATPLTLWFYAIFLFSQAKNGVSAKELERQLGVTYKCAWRIANKIRSLMGGDDDKLTGIIEVDEAYIGGKSVNGRHLHKTIADKEVLLGMVEREGSARVKHIISSGARVLIPAIKANVDPTAQIYSDSYGAYNGLDKQGFNHESVNHLQNEWVRNGIHTNTIEGFWSQLKRSINGTYHSVSPKYLQNYADEFAFRYSLRKSPYPMFDLLMKQV